MKNNAWISARKTINDGQNDPFSLGRAAADPQFSRFRIGEEVDILDALLELVEDGDATLEQCTAILSWLDALRTAVQKRDAERVFQVCNCLRNGGLGHVEMIGCFAHAAHLHDSHQDIKLAQLQAAPRPSVPGHRVISISYRAIRC